jgi:hypothetical protein
MVRLGPPMQATNPVSHLPVGVKAHRELFFECSDTVHSLIQTGSPVTCRRGAIDHDRDHDLLARRIAGELPGPGLDKRASLA